MMLQLLSVVAAVAVRGLKVGDSPLPEQLMGSKVVSAVGNDPELTNVLGEVFHVTVPGTYMLVGLPKESPADLVVEAKLEDLGTGACDDLLIRSVKIHGTKLGSKLSCLNFTVDSDVFNDTAALGLEVTGVDTEGAKIKMSPESFVQAVPACTITRPRAAIAPPLRTTYRKRTKLFTATCTLDGGANVITVTWSTVWRGFDKTENPMIPIYMNDLEVFVSGVGTDPAGLLGQEDHASVSHMIPGCFKKQPVNGPFQKTTTTLPGQDPGASGPTAGGPSPSPGGY